MNELVCPRVAAWYVAEGTKLYHVDVPKPPQGRSVCWSFMRTLVSACEVNDFETAYHAFKTERAAKELRFFQDQQHQRLLAVLVQHESLFGTCKFIQLPPIWNARSHADPIIQKEAQHIATAIKGSAVNKNNNKRWLMLVPIAASLLGVGLVARRHHHKPHVPKQHRSRRAADVAQGGGDLDRDTLLRSLGYQVPVGDAEGRIPPIAQLKLLLPSLPPRQPIKEREDMKQLANWLCESSEMDKFRQTYRFDYNAFPVHIGIGDGFLVDFGRELRDLDPEIQDDESVVKIKWRMERFEHKTPTSGETTTILWNVTTVQASRLLLSQWSRLKPAFLNFASDWNVGGGFERIHGSQEEDIFRKTTMFLSLWPHRRQGDEGGNSTRAGWLKDYSGRTKPRLFPMPIHSVVYTPVVGLVDIKTMKVQDGDVAGISVAAFNLNPGKMPRYVREGKTGNIRRLTNDLTWTDVADSTKVKLRLALQVAWIHGHQALVLGAIGCGDFRNPCHEIMKIWNELLFAEHAPFKNQFALVVFAVTAKKPDAPDSNFQVAKQTLQKLNRNLAVFQNGTKDRANVSTWLTSKS